MAFRRFVDRDKLEWEIRDTSRLEWEFSPVGENRERPRRVPPPGYEKDPYELSQEELQRLLDAAAAAPARNRPSPFQD
jgi:hypothetical protein